MKKTARFYSVRFCLREPPSSHSPPAATAFREIARCDISVHQAENQSFDIQADITLTDAEVARQVIRRLDWLDLAL